MQYAGLDLAAKATNPSGLAILQNSLEKPKLITLKNTYSDEQIIEALKGVGYLAIDAPLINGEIPLGYRLHEKQVIGWGLRLMTPSFLKGLVKRANRLIAKLPKRIEIIEVHPRSSALMLGLNTQRPLFNQPKLKQLIDINNLACANKHQFDALIGAYTAFLYQQKIVRKVGENGSFIALPISRNIKLVVFDMDGTLTRPTSSWEHIHRQLGTWEPYGKKYLKQFIAGEIDYQQFAKFDTSHWKGLPHQQIKELVQSIEYMPGIEKLMTYLAKKRVKIAVISGGLSVVADKITQDFGIKRIFVNDLIVKDGCLTGDVKINVSFNGKLKIYKKLLKELKIKPYQVLTVGDTNGDVPLFRNSGLAVAINPINKGIGKEADYEIKALDEIINFLEDLSPLR